MKVKKKAVQTYGGNKIECPPTLEARATTLIEVLKEIEANEVSPYNDASIIAGQGTVALELCRAVTGLDSVIASVGGERLISNFALALQTNWPDVQLFGAEPLNVDDA